MTELNLRCVAALSVAAGLVCGCGDTSTTTKADSSVEVAPPEETTVLDEGTPIVTIESTADIVAWGSHVLRVEVLAENERNTSPVGPGEELVGRDVIVQVSDVLWSHSDAVTAVDPGQRLTVYTFPGYLRAGEQTMPAVEEGHLRMDIGGRYVLVMAGRHYARGRADPHPPDYACARGRSRPAPGRYGARTLRGPARTRRREQGGATGQWAAPG